jgi:hypothetical protein
MGSKPIFKFYFNVVNAIMLLTGKALIIISSINISDKLSILNEFNKDLYTVIKAFETVNVLCLVAGIFLSLVSGFGLIGLKTSNRFFLLTYEVILVIIFIFQISILGIGITNASKIEKGVRKGYKIVIENSINKKNNNDTCEVLKLVSKRLKCCGAENKEDYSLNMICCDANMHNSKGCSLAVIDFIKDKSRYVVFFAGVILFLEILCIVDVPILIKNIDESETKDKNETASNNQLQSPVIFNVQCF